MGLFDNLVKALDDGNLEKTLSGALDKFESGLDKTVERAEKATAKLEGASHKIDVTVEKPQQ